MKKTMTRIAVGGLSLLIVVCFVYSFVTHAGAKAAHIGTVAQPAAQETVALAAPGRIEGLSDLVNVGAAIDGVIQSIKVKEGQTVREGEVLAEIGCSDLESALKVANSEADSLRQARVRLLRGSREEERLAAAQKTAAAHAVMEQASTQLTRMAKLLEAAAISKSSYDEARRDYDVAEAQYQAAKRNEELVDAGPLLEEVARADADVRAADDRVRLAQEKLSKCVVRAPISGTVLRVNLREGESFALLSPRPLFSMADASGRRVRAEVDERDVGKVHVNQKILITSDAYSHRAFRGTVTKLASIMGRKSVITGDPVDKADRDVLEVTARLDNEAEELPIGLRVTVQFIQ